MISTINVNLSKCRCSDHDPILCLGAPVLIPCPIPRSVTFEVVPGACADGEKVFSACRSRYHGRFCPARPVKVSCSISGETWEESNVLYFDPGDEKWDGPPATTLPAMRARWALVKALVLGQGRHVEDNANWPEALFNQRDAVFTALADMARAEDAHAAAYSEAFASMGKASPPPGKRAAHWVLAHYVDLLIEQIGVLSWSTSKS